MDTTGPKAAGPNTAGPRWVWVWRLDLDSLMYSSAHNLVCETTWESVTRLSILARSSREIRKSDLLGWFCGTNSEFKLQEIVG